MASRLEHPKSELYLQLRPSMLEWINLKDIRQIIHIGVPCSMVEFFQALRVGRDDLPTKAHTFYNSYDISKARKKLSPVIREYVQ